jgi:hypothetical protein
LLNAVPALQAIGIAAAIEVLKVAPARDQRVIPGLGIEALLSAVPTLQAIVTAKYTDELVATEKLTVALARYQRVIPAIASEPLISAVPAVQAIGIVAAKEALFVAPARDQRVIPGIGIEELTIVVTGAQKIIVRCARHEQDFFQNELVAAKARLLCWARKVKKLTSGAGPDFNAVS